jgi:hypothetical protein
VIGTLDGRSLSVALPIEDLEPDWGYAVEMLVSEDGTRMTGRIGLSAPRVGPVAMVRFDNDGPPGWLTSDDTVLEEAVAARSGGYLLRLVSETSDGPFVTGQSYELGISTRRTSQLQGDFGSFWAGELEFDPDGPTLTAGPVSATSELLPTTLVLHFADTTLERLVATMPSGTSYAFEPE